MATGSQEGDELGKGTTVGHRAGTCMCLQPQHRLLVTYKALGEPYKVHA